ncbi:phage integrase SAM-like domain-containing protein [Roseivirga pacifica]|uniref:phage integrase SAM-like domain-containing protein n=1 Tax=Roseivirga pacifica TaxID=1267423 RepID=UPI000B7F0056|nr:phage integrase SAM-like domain-containing protein [Roseivirga pacifica]
MSIILRQKDQGTGKIYIHLEFNLPGEKRRRKSTGLYLFSKPKNPTERKHNREIKELAEAIKSQYLIKVKNKEFGFNDDTHQKLDFYKYLDLLLRKKSDSLGNLGNWKSMKKHLQNFHNGELLFRDVNQTFVLNFKEYLDKELVTKNKQRLSQNSKQSYFAKFKAALKEAVRQGILTKDPSLNIQGFKDGDSQREF